jgi:hypothetical protein
MQPSAAFRTATIPGHRGKIVIKLKELLVESGVVQQSLVQASHPLLNRWEDGQDRTQ